MSLVTEQLSAAKDIIDTIIENTILSKDIGENDEDFTKIMKKELLKIYVPTIDWNLIDKIYKDKLGEYLSKQPPGEEGEETYSGKQLNTGSMEPSTEGESTESSDTESSTDTDTTTDIDEDLGNLDDLKL